MMAMSRQMRRGLWLVAIAWGLLALVQPAMAQDDGHVLVLTLASVTQLMKCAITIATSMIPEI